MLEIKYKIIKKIPLDRQIVVRFYTDLLTPEILTALKTPEGNPVLDGEGNVEQCRTDYLIQYPIEVLSSEEETKLIMAYCPWKWIEDEEKVLLANTTPNSVVDAVTSTIDAKSIGSVSTLSFTGTVILTPNQIKEQNKTKIDNDVDLIYARAIGQRYAEYAEAEKQANKFKADGYTGPVPSYVGIWLTTNNKGLTTAQEAADDIITQATNWATAATAMRAQRLARKKDVESDVPTAMAQWNGFVTAIKAQIFGPAT